MMHMCRTSHAVWSGAGNHTVRSNIKQHVCAVCKCTMLLENSIKLKALFMKIKIFMKEVLRKWSCEIKDQLQKKIYNGIIALLSGSYESRIDNYVAPRNRRLSVFTMIRNIFQIRK